MDAGSHPHEPPDGYTITLEEEIADYINGLPSDEIHYVAVRNGTDVVSAASVQQQLVVKEPRARNMTTAVLHGIAVPLLERRQGIGKTLIAYATQEAIKRTSVNLSLVPLGNEGSKDFLHVVKFTKFANKMRASPANVVRRTAPQ